MKKYQTMLSLNTKKNTKKNTQLEYLQVYYPDTLLQSIKHNQDITNISNVINIYKNQPKIIIQNAKAKLYLITMTDPDAPNGVKRTLTNSTQTQQQKNHTYTHWVYLQDMRKKNNNTSNKSQTAQIIIPYAPPTPPYGIHRYQFKIYDVTNVSQTILDTLKNKINNINAPDRNIYYRNNLKKLIKYKINTLFQYKVNSNK